MLLVSNTLVSNTGVSAKGLPFRTFFDLKTRVAPFWNLQYRSVSEGIEVV